MQYPLGSENTLTGTFTSPQTGLPTDPSTVTLYLQQPSQAGGAIATYTTSTGVVRQSAGVYTFVWTASIPGRWRYAWVGAGGAVQLDSELWVANSGLHG